jgi:HD-GYP domain-containing protein (c-di-GMP phosphodiesterase class II)
MYRDKLCNSKSVRSSIVETLTTAMDARDYSTENHSERLQKLVGLLANSIGFSSQEVNDICLFARFHDIGKVGIPDRILFKPGPLDSREVIEMRRHSEIGYRIASSSPDLIYISDWILKHHEWWNGKGYPLGISKKNIPVQCRILTIADAYDAMVNDRPYRKAMSKSKALEEIKRCAGQQFDPELAAKFIEIIKDANI